MRVFCSQCGTPNEGQPGTKVMCTNCTAVFDVPTPVDPGLAATVPSKPATAPGSPATPQSQLAPPLGPGAQPQASWGSPAVNPGLPGPLYPAPAASKASTDGLAIASLVLGILCCFPFNVAAIICGVLSLQKIKVTPMLGGRGLAIAGIVLGSTSSAFTLLGIFAAIFQH